MIRAAILGASGYVGGELMRLIAGHPAMEVGVAFGASKPASRSRRSIRTSPSPIRTWSSSAWDAALLDGCDLILAALPHGETQRLADELLAPGIPFVDLGADFRLDSAAEYERWYGEPHARARAARPLRLRHSRTLPRRDRGARSASPRRAAIRPRRSWR